MPSIVSVTEAVVDVLFPGCRNLLEEIRKLCSEVTHEKEEYRAVLTLLSFYLDTFEEMKSNGTLPADEIFKTFEGILNDYKNRLIEATKRRRRRDRVLEFLTLKEKPCDLADIRKRIDDLIGCSVMHTMQKVRETGLALPTPTDSSSSASSVYPDVCELPYIATDDRGSPVNEDAIKLLLQQVLTSEIDDQTTAVGKLRNLAASNRANRTLMAKLGVIPVLSGSLTADSTILRQSAACALGNLAYGNKQNCELIAASLDSLVGLLGGVESEPEYAAYALGHLADRNPEIRQVIMKESTAIMQLIKRVREGSPVQKAYAAFALASISLKNEEAWRVAEEQCIMPVLYDLLKDGSVLEKGYAAYALGCLASDKASNSERIQSLGAIPLLVILANEFSLQRQYGIFALGWLANRPDARHEIVEHQTIPMLMKILRTGRSLEKQHSAYALGILAHSRQFREKIANCNAVQALTPLLTGSYRSDAPRLKQHAACAVGWILSIEATRDGIETDEMYRLMSNLIELISEFNEESPRQSEKAVHALAQLLKSEKARALPITKQSVARLVPLLTPREKESAKHAAKALYWLSHDKAFSVHIGTDKDGISALIRLVDKAPTQHRMHAAKTLNQLAQDRANRSKIVASNGIEPLLRILQSNSTPEELPLVSVAACVLAELTRDNQGRDRIVKNLRIESLVALLSPENGLSTPLQGSAAFALGRLAYDKNIRAQAGCTGAVQALIPLVNHIDPKQRGYVVFALSRLAINEINLTLIVENNGVRPLVKFFQEVCKCEASQLQHKRDASLVVALLANKRNNRKEIGANKTIPQLISLLHDDDEKCQHHAALILTSLVHTKEFRTEIGVFDGVEALIKLLGKSNGGKERKPVIESLRWLALEEDNRTKIESVRSAIQLPSEEKIQLILDWRRKPEFTDTNWDLQCETKYENNPWRSFGTEFKPKTQLLQEVSPEESPRYHESPFAFYGCAPKGLDAR